MVLTETHCCMVGKTLAWVSVAVLPQLNRMEQRQAWCKAIQ